MPGGKPLDLVVFGATGFTGRLVTEYLATRFGVDGSQLKWTIAGRSAAKLAELRSSLGNLSDGQLAPIVADVGSTESLRAMCKQTSVIVTTVGPFAIYGEGLVAACVEESTDYADITGETQFVRRMIDQHDVAAREKGVRIVSMAGYDSVPSDIGTFVAVTEFCARFPGRYPSFVKSVGGKSRGGVSGGTCASVFNILENSSWAELRQLANPYILCPGIRGADTGQQTRPIWEPQLLTARPQWSSFFVMGSVNAAVCRRSQHLLQQQPTHPGSKAPPYSYDEAMACGKGCAGFSLACFLTIIPLVGALCMIFPPLRWLLKYLAPSPGEGPSQAQRDGGCFNHHIVARGEPGTEELSIGVKFSCDFADPGYKGTALMLATAGVSLALDQNAADEGVSGGGGILTPAVALGQPYIERLKSEGIRIEVLQHPAAKAAA